MANFAAIMEDPSTGEKHWARFIRSYCNCVQCSCYMPEFLRVFLCVHEKVNDGNMNALLQRMSPDEQVTAAQRILHAFTMRLQYSVPSQTGSYMLDMNTMSTIINTKSKFCAQQLDRWRAGNTRY